MQGESALRLASQPVLLSQLLVPFGFDNQLLRHVCCCSRKSRSWRLRRERNFQVRSAWSIHEMMPLNPRECDGVLLLRLPELLLDCPISNILLHFPISLTFTFQNGSGSWSTRPQISLVHEFS